MVLLGGTQRIPEAETAVFLGPLSFSLEPQMVAHWDKNICRPLEPFSSWFIHLVCRAAVAVPAFCLSHQALEALIAAFRRYHTPDGSVRSAPRALRL